MADRLSTIESQVHELERSLANVEQRLAALEIGARAVPPPRPDAEISRDRDVDALHYEAGAAIALVGRTFVALGGAYLLRALTDSGILPQRLGIGLGILYALAWISAADRDGGRGRRLSAAFHALVGVLIAFPLLWEATARFQDLSPAGGALVLSAVTAIATAVAVRRGHQAIAWIVMLAAIPTAIASISVTGALIPFVMYLIGLGVLTLWLGYSCDWVWLRWPAALIADVSVLALTFAGVGRNPVASPAAIVAVQMLLLNAYLASIVIRTIFRARDVIGFEIMQALAALAVGFGGAAYIAEQTGFGTALLALINLAFGVACYIVGFVFMRQGRPRNFHFYSSLAIVLVVASSALLLTPRALALVAAALAVVAAWTARRLSKVTLVVHAIAYLVTAGAASGMLASAAGALVGPVTGPWLRFDAVATTVVIGYAVCWAIAPAIGLGPFEAPLARVVVALLLVFGGAGAAIALVASFLPQTDGAALDPGAIATVRTAVLAGAAVALAWAGQRHRFRESRWLFYPVLAVAGIKLLVEDLPRSKPQTLFVALAVYGLALIAAPRLNHRRIA